MSDATNTNEPALTISESMKANEERGGFLHRLRNHWRRATLRSGRPQPGVYDKDALESSAGTPMAHG